MWSRRNRKSSSFGSGDFRLTACHVLVIINMFFSNIFLVYVVGQEVQLFVLFSSIGDFEVQFRLWCILFSLLSPQLLLLLSWVAAHSVFILPLYAYAFTKGVSYFFCVVFPTSSGCFSAATQPPSIDFYHYNFFLIPSSLFGCCLFYGFSSFQHYFLCSDTSISFFFQIYLSTLGVFVHHVLCG